MHPLIKESGLAELYKIRPVITNYELAKFLGKTVRYKRERITPEFLRLHGTVSRDEYFVIREVQKNFEGRDVLRGYIEDGSEAGAFGRCIDPDDIEIVEV